MDQWNLNLVFAAFLNVLALAFTFLTQERHQKGVEKVDDDAAAEEPVRRPEPTTNQMMLSKWGHVG